MKKLLRLRRVGESVWTDGKRKYYFAEVDSSGEVYIPTSTPNRLIYVDASKKVTSVLDLTDWIAGTVLEITVTDDADGSVTIALANNTVIPGAPTISDYTNAEHDHSDAADGGTVSHVDITNKESDGEPHTVSKTVALPSGTTELSVANGYLTDVVEEYVFMTVA